MNDEKCLFFTLSELEILLAYLFDTVDTSKIEQFEKNDELPYLVRGILAYKHEHKSPLSRKTTIQLYIESLDEHEVLCVRHINNSISIKDNLYTIVISGNPIHNLEIKHAELICKHELETNHSIDHIQVYVQHHSEETGHVIFVHSHEYKKVSLIEKSWQSDKGFYQETSLENLA